MRNSTLAELILADARDRGLRHFFGLPGGGAPLDLLDAGRRYGVEPVNVAHESSAGIMAAYYGALKGTAGLALAVKGVGAGNLVGGAANAYFERLPLVALCECSPSDWKQRELLQHCSHEKLFGGVMKYHATLSADDAARQLQEAVFQATDGRPGTVLLDLPSNLGLAEVAASASERRTAPLAPPHGQEIQAVHRHLAASSKPVVVAGADVARCHATEELKRLVESIGAAVLVNMDARGVFPESHPRWAGVLVGNYTPNIIETEVLCHADLVLLVGTDAMMTHVPWKCDPPTCELVAREEYETLSPSPKTRVNGDLKCSLKQLAAEPRRGFREDEIRAMRRKISVNFKRPPPARLAAQDIIEIARRLLPQEGICCTETGAFIRMMETLWSVDRYGTYFGTGGGRSMGMMVPGLLGAALAKPDAPMIGIGADGSLRMRLGELDLFARHKVRVPLVIINDQALGTMKSRQKSRGFPAYGLDLQPVDFAAVARACGLNGVTVDNPEAFEKELQAAMHADRATLLDARIDAEAYQDGFGPTIGVL